MTLAPNVFDIAREAGVSKSTAARALSGQGSVSELARARVLAAADQLKYRANTGARNLRRGENHLLGVVVPASGSQGFLSHTVNAQKLEGIAVGAKRLGFDVQIFLEDLSDGDALRRLATDRNVRGLFFNGVVDLPVLDHLNTYQIPWVGLNWRHRDLENAAYVWTDFHHAGATLAGHLFDQGCRRVLAFDWLSSDYGPFEEGLMQAVFDRNLPYAALDIRQGRSYYDAGPALAALRAAFATGQPQPDGVVFGSAPAAIAGYQFLRAERPELVLGRDVRLAVFDDFDKTAALEPALTAYAQNMNAIGQAAVVRMGELLSGSGVRGEQKVPGALRVRASSGNPSTGGTEAGS